MSESNSQRLTWASWAVRISYTAVFLVNVTCALSFVVVPQAHAGAYELTGVSGMVAVQGLGIAFLMWNVTYPLVIAQPLNNRAMASVVLIQQLIGLVGESLIFTGLPTEHEVLASGIIRFITFDGAGFIAMGVSFIWLCREMSQKTASAKG